MTTRNLPPETAVERQVRMAFKIGRLTELANTAEAYDWIVLQGNIGERSDKQATADFRDAVSKYREYQGIQAPDPADDPSNAVSGK